MVDEATFYPGGKWEFNQSVAENFPDMLQRSIPELDGLRQLIGRIAQEKEVDSVFELGCSDGQMLQVFLEHGVIHVGGVDNSAPMLARARDRLDPWYWDGRVTIYEDDVRYFGVPDGYDLYASVLTLQFVPVEDRLDVLRDIRGPLVIVEKISAPEFFVQTYHSFKESNGYTREEIEEKARSLESVLVPLSSEQNEALLATAGFKSIQPFWQWMNFKGWIAER